VLSAPLLMRFCGNQISQEDCLYALDLYELANENRYHLP